eukprot:TRINITY_DN65765_c0_g1_i1.p1 TRINITY_DN65765_c0_g1~~TRINITY_DN65765_c0_g1_i1.p1  ORF type:complete len:260 (-),score=49.36 TRINITY_DN65765_c0_g1_i1:210-989(-)
MGKLRVCTNKVASPFGSDLRQGCSRGFATRRSQLLRPRRPRTKALGGAPNSTTKVALGGSQLRPFADRPRCPASSLGANQQQLHRHEHLKTQHQRPGLPQFLLVRGRAVAQAVGPRALERCAMLGMAAFLDGCLAKDTSAHHDELGICCAHVLLALIGCYLGVHLAFHDRHCAEGVAAEGCDGATLVRSEVYKASSLLTWLDVALHGFMVLARLLHWSHELLKGMEAASLMLAAVTMVCILVAELFANNATCKEKQKHD